MKKSLRWSYLLSSTHLVICSICLLALWANWSAIAVLWQLVPIIDLPFSAPYYILAWSHATAAVLWVLVTGTAWWYFLGWLADRRIQSRSDDRE